VTALFYTLGTVVLLYWFACMGQRRFLRPGILRNRLGGLFVLLLGVALMTLGYFW